MSSVPTNLAQGFDAPEEPGSGENWLSNVLSHIREEYDDMPGLCLTLPQAQRLWGLDAATSQRAIALLVETGYLRASAFGYVRA